MKRSINYLFFILACVVTLPACAGLMYSAEPMEARVVDAESNKPIEGVIVVAHWELERGTVGGSVPAGQLMVMETITDSQGKFSFPGFGPKPAVTSHLVHKDPELILFKSGYRYLVLTNEYSGDIKLRTRTVRRSDWNGKTVEMKKFTGTPEEWFKMLERVIPPYEKSEDAKQSLMLKAILAEENSIPNSIERKHLFFDNVVRRLLQGR
jgi:hypothetical protein